MYNWTEHTAVRQRSWQCIATSADGIRIAAGVNGGYIYTSADYGATWNVHTPAGYRQWQLLASDAAGQNLIAAVTDEYLYTSVDYGVTWTVRTGPGLDSWSSVDISSDGSAMFALSQSGTLYKSINLGVNWTNCAVGGHIAMACSDDGQKIITVHNGGYVYLSSDSGAGHEHQQSTLGTNTWSAAAISADGTHIVAAVDGGYIYISADFGTTWTTLTSAGSKSWKAVSIDANGSRLAAIANGTDYIYTSEDGGVVWNPQANTNKTWNSIALSSIGINVAAVVNGGYIYTAILDTTSFNMQQVKNLTILSNLTTTDGVLLSDILTTINTELTVPLQLIRANDNLFTVNVGTNIVVDPTIQFQRVAPPIGGVIPIFAGGTVLFPSAVGGTIAISPGVNVLMPDIGINSFVKIGISVSTSGEIKLLFGVSASSELSATIPNGPIDIGYIVISTDGSNNLNPIDGSDIYQYTGSSNNAGATYAPASEFDEGIVTTTTQTFAGNKTLVNQTTVGDELIANKINDNINGTISSMIAGVPGNPGLGFSDAFWWPPPAGDSFSRGILLPNNKVLLINNRYTMTNNIYNVSTKLIENGPIPPNWDAFRGAVLLPDGRVFLFPATYLGTNTLYSHSSNSWIAGPVNYGENAFAGGVILPNGKLFCLNRAYTGTDNLYNPLTNAWEVGMAAPMPGNTGANMPFLNAILLPNGKVLCIANSNDYTGTKYIYNPTTMNWEDGPSHPDNIISGVLLPSGKVFCVGDIAYTGTSTIYNPATNLWEAGPYRAPSVMSLTSPILLSNGKVACLPNNGIGAFSATIYNPITNLWENGPESSTSPGINVFVNGVLLPTGNILGIPARYSDRAEYNSCASGWPYGRWMLYPKNCGYY